MEIVAFCYIGERCKKICWSKSVDVPDVESVRLAILKETQTDEILREMISDKYIIIQKKNFLNILCDVEKDDSINHNDILTVILIPKLIGKNVEIIHEIQVPNNNIISDQTLNESNDTESFDVKEKEDEPVAKKVKVEKKCRVPYPVQLPQLPKVLQKMVDDNTMYENQNQFIALWAAHLSELTDGVPSKTEYSNYATTIVDTYPKLGGGQSYCGIVKKQLSAKMRNSRAYPKIKEKKNLNKASTSGTKPIKLSAEIGETSRNADVEDSLNELKKCDQNEDSKHVRRLLSITQKAREDWIKTTATNVGEIVKEYPQLKVYSLAIFEFCTMKKKNEEILLKSANDFIKTCGFFFEKSTGTEEEKALIVQQLCNHLLPKRFKKLNEKLIIVKPAGKSTADLVTSDNSSIRCVIYTEEKGIVATFIVAAGLKSKIPEPTTDKVLVGLLAFYYITDTEYPPAYVSFLHYLDSQLLGTAYKADTPLDRFLRDLNQKLSE